MPKRNVRKVPRAILKRLDRIPGQSVVAACLRILPSAELRQGALKHFRVKLTDSGLSLPAEIVPPSGSGKYSEMNREGYVVVRRDLPKETHYHSVDTPNWGDPYYGTHSVDLPYEMYPRDYYGPELIPIAIDCRDREPGRDTYALTFRVEKVLDRGRREFMDELLKCLNLLQENVGLCGVERSGVQFEDYVETQRLAWEVLPPGTREEAVARVFGGKAPTDKERKQVEERYDFLMRLRPQKLVYGTSGFQRYFGGLLADDCVIFENIEYGNAIYIMFQDWEELSRRSRTELMSGRYGENFERVPHVRGWKGRVRDIVKAWREEDVE